MFKIMHWPGAGLLWLVGLGVLFFLFLPLYFFTGIRNPETKLNTILSSIMILIAGGLLFTLTALPGHDKEMNSAFDMSSKHLRETVYDLSKINQSKYSLADDSIQTDNGILKEKTAALIDNIVQLKKDLLMYLTNGEKLSEEEYLSFKPFYSGPPTMYLFNDRGVPKPYLSEIKTGMIELKKFIDSKYGKEKSELLSTSNRLKCNGSRDINVIWEHAYFYHVPLDYVFRNFDQLLLNIRITEASCIK